MKGSRRVDNAAFGIPKDVYLRTALRMLIPCDMYKQVNANRLPGAQILDVVVAVLIVVVLEALVLVIEKKS